MSPLISPGEPAGDQSACKDNMMVGGKHQSAVERGGAYVPSREPIPREVCKRALQVPPARQAFLADAQDCLQHCTDLSAASPGPDLFLGAHAERHALSG